MKIDEILRIHARPASLLAAEPVKKALLADLRAHKRLNSIIYAVLFALHCALGLMAIAALFTDLVQASRVRIAILGAAGVGIPASLLGIQRVVREWSHSNLLITLVSHSDEAAIQSLINKLLSATSIGFEAPVQSPKARK